MCQPALDQLGRGRLGDHEPLQRPEHVVVDQHPAEVEQQQAVGHRLVARVMEAI
jgi:hypothetical protein